MSTPQHPEIKKNIIETAIFGGRGNGEGFSFFVDPYAPYIATAIHAGNQIRNELMPLMKISPENRFLEEDPATDTMIQDAASAIWGVDSRSEYDLNRPRKDALPLTPEKFWGIQVYRHPLEKGMMQLSLEKYDQFYAFMGSWAKAVLHRFGVCIVYDIHSYNINRQIRKGFVSPPLFNVGTRLLNRRRWETAIEDWINRLNQISIPGIPTTVEENSVFEGKGELCREMTRWDKSILVLPTEISKAYMNEQTGVINKRAVTALRKHLGSAMADHSRNVLEQYGTVQP